MLALLALTPTVGTAQESTRVVGRVTNSAGAPIAAAQVSISDMRVGGMSNETGAYSFTVPASDVHGQAATLTVRRIGHKPESRSITLTPGTITQNFVLQVSTVSLDQVVVTGTPGATRQKELGNTIGTIDVAGKLRDAPINNIQQLFQSREPGLKSIASSGEAGTANNIVLRGVNSLSQSNQPLIYVDGILINQSNTSLIPYTGGQTTSRLNDLNVNDIARVEIIKGASATTLYGSQASGGVIQIFTKRGAEQGSEVTLHAEMGGARMPDRFPYQAVDHSVPNANDLITTGLVQNFDLAVRGTAGAGLGYYASGNFSGENGSFPNNAVKKAGARLNATVSPSSSVSLDLSTNYLYNNTNIPQNGYTAAGIVLPIELGSVAAISPANPFGSLGYPVATFLLHKDNETYDRFIGGLTANHSPLTWFSQRLTVGLDVGSGKGMDFNPYGGAYAPLGFKSYQIGHTTLANVDYAATARSTITGGIKSTFSLGGQLNTTHQDITSAAGANFAIPNFDALGGTSTQSVAEARTQYTTGGVFGQEELGFGDRLFVTAGLRVDGSTSFGKNFGTQKYPKFGVSYVVSEEPWFHVPGVSSLKLRSAWGKAGKLPGAFDAVQTYIAIPTGTGGAGLVASNPGNPDLAPEITREWEEGFDAGLWGDRVSLKVTAYQSRTDQAILSQPGIGSNGFTPPGQSPLPSAFLSNAGSLQNRGLEVGLDWTAIQSQRLEWDWSVNYAHNASKILNLGGLPFIVVDAFGTRLEVGRPVSSKIANISDGFTPVGVPTYQGQPINAANPQYIGPAIPPNNGSLSTRLRFGSFSASANAQWVRGGYTTDYTLATQRRFNTGEALGKVLAANNGDKTAAAYRAYVGAPLGDFIYKSDNVRLREVTLSYNLPKFLTRGNTASVYVSGRNLALWTKYPGVDPEASVTFGGTGGSTPGAGLSVGTEYATSPQPRYILVGTNISFSRGTH